MNVKMGRKNWLPLIIKDKLYTIYSFDPFTIFQIEKDGTYIIVIQKQQNFDLSTFRGSAGPLIFNEEYLIMIHELICMDENVNYYHRFLYLDSDLNITKISDRFTFMNENIEFSCGMTLDHSDQKLVISVGIWDKEAYLYFIDVNYVNSLLKAID